MNIFIALFFLDLIFVNIVCIVFCVYGFSLIKKMKGFLDMFGGVNNEIR